MSRIPFRPGEGISRLLPILRVEGFEPGSPQAEVLANHFAGSLRQFYHGQAALAEASGLQQWAKAVDRGDHQIRYVSQFGSETVTLRVHPQVVGEVFKKPEPELPWDWAIVDFDVPVLEHYYQQLAATLLIGGFGGFYIRCQQVPFERDPVSGIEMGAAGIDIAFWRSGEGMTLSGDYDTTKGAPMIAIYDPLGPDDPAIQTGDVNIEKMSVRIDLRKFPKIPELTFEIYANLKTSLPDFGTTYSPAPLGWLAKLDTPRTVHTIDGPASPNDDPPPAYDGLIYSPDIPGGVAYGSFKFSPNPGGPPHTYSLAGDNSYLDYPNIHLWSYPGEEDYTGVTIIFSEELTFSLGLAKYINFFGVGSDGIGVPFLYRTTGASGSAYPVYGETVGEIPVTVTSQMTVSAAMFRGTPPWEGVIYDIPFDPGEWYYSRWDIEGRSPRFRQAQIGAAQIRDVQLDFPPSDDNYFYDPGVQRNGRPYLGKLTVSPTKGYVTFKPA